MVSWYGSLVYLDNCEGASRACYRVDVSDWVSEGYDGILYWRWDGVVTRWRCVCFSLWNAREALLVLLSRYLMVLNLWRGIFRSIHGWCRKQKGNYRGLFMRRNSDVFEQVIIFERGLKINFVIRVDIILPIYVRASCKYAYCGQQVGSWSPPPFTEVWESHLSWMWAGGWRRNVDLVKFPVAVEFAQENIIIYEA